MLFIWRQKCNCSMLFKIGSKEKYTKIFFQTFAKLYSHADLVKLYTTLKGHKHIKL